MPFRHRSLQGLTVASHVFQRRRSKLPKQGRARKIWRGLDSAPNCGKRYWMDSSTTGASLVPFPFAADQTLSRAQRARCKTENNLFACRKSLTCRYKGLLKESFRMKKQGRELAKKSALSHFLVALHYSFEEGSAGGATTTAK
eukprot:SAG31_NODE_44_length_31168_cov_16.507290_17_plen_143_part_00